MKLAGVARFDCIGSTQEFACYMAGLASPRRSHLRLDDQRAAQSPCLAILVPLGMWRLIDNKRHRGSGGWPHPYPRCAGPDHTALHPLRRDTPVTSRCTRYVAIHPIRRGAMPTDRVHHLPQQAQPRAIPPDTPQPFASDAATQLRHAHPGSEREALHQLGSVTPPPSWCNTPLSGVTPARNKQQCGYALQHASRYVRQAAQRRLKRRFTTEKHAPATRPLTAAPISRLGRATPLKLVGTPDNMLLSNDSFSAREEMGGS